MDAFPQSTARIAAWNLAGGRFGIRPDRREEQVRGLEYLDAEVVALVEVNPPDALETLKKGLTDRGVEYDSVLVPQENDLHIGVLFKKGIEVKKHFLLDGSDLGDSAYRKALVVDMKIRKFTFKLIVVHLKSSRPRANQKIRDDQCKFIGKFIHQELVEKKRRKTILLVGDFNMIPGKDVSNFHYLGGDDLMDFLSSWDLQARFSHIKSKGRANLLDGFAISRTYSTRYVRGSLRLFPMHWTMKMGREEYRKKVSDHLPFVATFRIR